MKILIAISVVLSFSITVLQGQSYHPLLIGNSNYWYYALNVIPVNIINNQPAAFGNCTYPIYGNDVVDHLFTEKDTTISGQNYSKLIQTGYNNPFDSCTIGFIREDTILQKVYFLDTNFSPEQLIYDFSMVPGDSILLDFVQTGGYYPDGYYKLDSISVINIHLGQRRAFFLSNSSQINQIPLTWIESVGHPGYLIYSYSANVFGGLFQFICVDYIPRDFYYLLSCFEHGNQKVYFDSCAHSIAIMGGCMSYADSCNYWNICGGINENDIFSYFKISPNPAVTILKIDLISDFDSESSFTINTMEGKAVRTKNHLKIIPGNNSFLLDINGLDSGIYLIECQTRYGVAVKKFIKTR